MVISWNWQASSRHRPWSLSTASYAATRLTNPFSNKRCGTRNVVSRFRIPRSLVCEARDVA